MSATQLIISVAGGLALFLFGMKVMSEGLQRVAGPRMRRILAAMTANRIVGVGTGVLVTCAVQSSSATTVMLVGFVHAGLITLYQSIGVIMGANIGTTVTGWLVALLGFKIKITAMALPAVTIGILPRVVGVRRLFDWGDVLVGFGILFLGLNFMKDSVSELKESATLISWIASVRADMLGWRLAAVGVGALVTVLVQSSSATMAITMTLAAQGLVDLPTACALVLGENIGTTITANLAALHASTTAKKAARAHLLFNVSGATWAVLLFMPFLALVEWIMPGGPVGSSTDGAATIAATLAAFHTLFNFANTSLFLPFVRQLAWVASRLVPSRNGTGELGLLYLNPSVIQTVPMALHAARSELGRMLDEVRSMLTEVLEVAKSPERKLGPMARSIESSEQTVDYLEREIAAYVVSLTRQKASVQQSREIAGILSAVSDIERMGDHCEQILKLSQRRHDKNLRLNRQARAEIDEIGEWVSSFLTLLKENLDSPADDLMVKASAHEETVDRLRTSMRRGHVQRLHDGLCDVDSGLLFIDMLTSFEKIGDHAFNVAEMLAGER